MLSLDRTSLFYGGRRGSLPGIRRYWGARAGTRKQNCCDCGQRPTNDAITLPVRAGGYPQKWRCRATMRRKQAAAESACRRLYLTTPARQLGRLARVLCSLCRACAQQLKRVRPESLSQPACHTPKNAGRGSDQDFLHPKPHTPSTWGRIVKRSAAAPDLFGRSLMLSLDRTSLLWGMARFITCPPEE
jgi:hypothetical protein